MAALPAGLSQRRVLLTDDDPFVRTVYADTLRGRGCEVTEARSGEECVTIARTLQPDLVLMDLSMPGMDGWQSLAALRGHPETRDLPVIALTASITGDVRVRALEAGFDEFIAKPFTPRMLLRELDTAWQQVQRRRQAPPPEAAPTMSYAMSMPVPAV